MQSRREYPLSQRLCKGLALCIRVLHVLLGLLRRTAGISLSVGVRPARPACLNTRAEALRARKLVETTVREFVVDVKSRNALAQGLELYVWICASVSNGHTVRQNALLLQCLR